MADYAATLKTDYGAEALHVAPLSARVVDTTIAKGVQITGVRSEPDQMVLFFDAAVDAGAVAFGSASTKYLASPPQNQDDKTLVVPIVVPDPPPVTFNPAPVEQDRQRVDDSAVGGRLRLPHAGYWDYEVK